MRNYLLLRYTLKSFLFQVLRELSRLKYINVKQLSMIEHKITKRNLELINHTMHFDVINVKP